MTNEQIRLIAFFAAIVLRAAGRTRDEANEVVNDHLSDFGIAL